LNYLSVCSGIEAATVAWHDLGWKPAGFSEIEKFPSQVLAHHYPTVTNFGDMTKYKEWNLNDSIGLLVGGTPCQSFSVAGLRKGLDDPRGNLALTYVGILDKFRPKWCIWENVPGVLSSGGGRDFGSFLGALGELGYGWAYRVLDAQNFGVAQRRRRVFVVGYLGDWKPAAEVLFESESLSGNIKPSRAQRESVTGYVESSFGQYREDVIAGTSKASGGVLGGGSETFIAYEWHNQDSRIKPVEIAATLNCNAGGREGHLVQNVAYGFEPGITKREGNPSRFNQELSPTLRADMGDNQVATVFAQQPIPEYYAHQYCQDRVYSTEGITPALNCSQAHKFRFDMAVRRLTPVECERLQGFPDNYTNIKENCPDGGRYKALGNSMAVPVMRWIGERINKYEQRGVEKHL
jgi:DNA (cytosine-5)-methyltransferase 1